MQQRYVYNQVFYQSEFWFKEKFALAEFSNVEFSLCFREKSDTGLAVLELEYQFVRFFPKVNKLTYLVVAL